MKKRVFISTMVSICCLALQAQILPEPALRFDFKPESLNESQISAAKGNAVGSITDGSGAIKDDAEIVNDEIRGNVLKLPNIAPGGTGGDVAANYRCLRISNSKVEENTPSLVADGDYAISFWVKGAPTGKLNGFPAIMEFDQLPSKRSYAMRINAFWADGNKTSLRIGDGVADRVVSTSYTSESHIYTWTHILIQRSSDDSNVYVYINGQFAGKKYYNGVITNQAPADKCLLNSDLKFLRFNSMAHGGYTYLSDIQIFNAFLSEEQIAELQKIDRYEIKVSTYPAEVGTVTPSFTAEKESTVSVNAEATAGYLFSHWIDGDTIVSRDATYTFKATGSQTLTAVFRTPEEVQPPLLITGANFLIQPVRNGSYPFQNRSNMQFQNTSAAIIGQQYTQINANAGTNPGPLAEFSAQAETDGYIYVLVNDGQEDLKEAIQNWATAGQWEKVDHLSNVTRYHTALVTDQYSVYRKAAKAGEWVKIEQTGTFSGAILIAPSLTITDPGIPEEYNIETGLYPTEGGTVTPSFTAEEESMTSVNATAAAGYVFSHWIDGDTIVSREATYTFKVTGDQKLTAVFRTPEEIQPALQITGANYKIQPVRNGSYPYQNRDNMQFQNTSAAIIGQQYTQINANSSYKPGPLAELYAKAETDGYIYVLTNDGQEDLKEAIQNWATAGQWEKADHLSDVIRYSTTLPTDQYSIYRKAVKAQEWVKIEQTGTFSGALLIAPSLTVTDPEIQEKQDTIIVKGILTDQILETINTSLTPTTVSVDLTECSFLATTTLGFNANPHLLVFLPANAEESIQVTGAIGVKEGTAINPVELNGAYSFNAPQDITADISYIRSFTAISGEDSDTETNGWQSIVLPFTVTDITAVQNGETIHLVPFKEWDFTQNPDSKRPFWLYKAENGGFTAASNIEANTSYLIAIPNAPGYDAFFNVTGDITFHGAAITTTALSQGDNAPGYLLVPNFAGEKENVYALNAEGSQWVSAQSVESFQAYASIVNGTSPQFLPIFGEGGIPTGLRTISGNDSNSSIQVYTTDGGVIVHSTTPGSITIFKDNGQLVKTQPIGEGDNFITLNSGKYIINTHVVLVK